MFGKRLPVAEVMVEPLESGTEGAHGIAQPIAYMPCIVTLCTAITCFQVLELEAQHGEKYWENSCQALAVQEGHP
jgi:hypothetical protein